MNQDKKPYGFLYYWTNDPPTPTIKRVPCEVYSRIVGYLRPKRNWNKGKRQEDKDRLVYDLPDVVALGEAREVLR